MDEDADEERLDIRHTVESAEAEEEDDEYDMSKEGDDDEDDNECTPAYLERKKKKLKSPFEELSDNSDIPVSEQKVKDTDFKQI
jgi:hypothetical protein